MRIPESITVTDQEIDLTCLKDTQKKYFISLAEHIKDKYAESGLSRYVIGISGSSGSGKSVLSSILVELLKDEEGFSCQTVDLDAFHYPNNVLTEKNLIGVKGRYDTYDTNTLQELLKGFKNNTQVVFPRYSREDHEPHTDGSVIRSGNFILLLPGLWIQRDDDEWNRVRNYIDYTIKIEGDSEKFKQNTINRHMRGGRSREGAEIFYDNSDSKNTDEITQNSVPANLVLPYFDNIQKAEDVKFIKI